MSIQKLFTVKLTYGFSEIDPSQKDDTALGNKDKLQKMDYTESFSMYTLKKREYRAVW